MELIQLISFYQIVKTGSFSKASETVFRSQSAISHQIKNLEEELNVKLFERVGTKVKLTEGGKALFPTISHFLNDLENLKRMFGDMHDAKSGTLIVAASSATMTYLLPDVVKKFEDEFHGIKLRLVNCILTRELILKILEGDVDLGIGPKLDEKLSEKINFLFWKSYEKVLLAPKGHHLSRKKSVNLDDIAAYPLIVYGRGAYIRNVVEEAFSRHELPYEIKMEMDSAENIKKYVQMNLGISIVSSLTITDADTNKFAFLNVSNLFGKTDYGIYYRKNKYITTAMREFIKILAPELSNKFSSPCPFPEHQYQE